MWVTAVIANLPELIMWLGFGGIMIWVGRRWERWLWELPKPATWMPWRRERNVEQMRAHLAQPQAA